MKVIIIYYSKGGKTKKMAEEISKGAEEGGAEVKLKKFLDDSIKIRGELEDKIGAAFASSGHRARGRETTILRSCL